jgi:hypothetical protein
LGNLTVSPRHLGTALIIEASLGFNDRIDTNIDKDITDEIEYGKNIKVINRLATGEKDLLIRTE